MAHSLSHAAARMAALALLALAPLTASASDPDVVPMEGLLAPSGAWTTTGGSVARNAAALTDLTHVVPTERWTFSAAGTIEGDPLVWGRRVFVASRISKTERVLEVLDLGSGEVLESKEFSTPLELAPSIWGETIGIRTGPSTISFYAIKGTRNVRLERIGEYEPECEVGRPLLFGAEAFVPTAMGLVRLRAQGAREVWKAPGYFTGAASLLGEHVFGIQYIDQNAYLSRYSRATGTDSLSKLIGHHGGALPDVDSEAYVAVSEREAIVHHAMPIEAESGKRQDTVQVDLRRGRMEVIGSLARDQEEALCASGWLTFLQPMDDTLVIFEIGKLSKRKTPMQVLANGELHPEVGLVPIDASVAGSTLLIGGHAVDDESLNILWKLDVTARARVVPATDCVLVRTSSKKLWAFGKPALREEPIVIFPADLPTAEAGGHVLGLVRGIDNDGEPLEGKFLLAGDGQSIREDRSRKPLEFNIEDLAYLETDAGLPLVFGDAKSLSGAVAGLYQASAAEAYLDLAFDARKSKDLELIERLLALALQKGAEGKRIESIEKEIAKLVAKPPKSAVERRVQEALARELELQAGPIEALWQRRVAAGDALDTSTRLALLNQVLELAPKHVQATTEVLGLVDARLLEMKALDGGILRGIRAENDAQASEWVEFLEVTERQQFTVITPVPDGAGLTPEQRRLGQATNRWRPDLFLLRSGPVQIITPLTNPGALSRCVRIGEVVCSVLEKEFAPYAAAQREQRPMTLYLYEDEQEYMKKSMGIGREMRGTSTWQAGHYSPSENLQHIWLPESKAGFESVMQTYIHEMTHNWMETRCPMYMAEDSQVGMGMPGFWLVEGFADFVESFQFDFEAGTANPRNQRASGLDTVANSSELLSWETLFRMGQAHFAGLDREPALEIQFTWRLGMVSRASATSLFYAQSEATVQYLYHAKKGAMRDTLFAMLKAYYTSDLGNIDLCEALETTPEALGEAIVEFARKSIGEQY